MNIENIKRANEIAEKLRTVLKHIESLEKLPSTGNGKDDVIDVRVCRYNGYSTDTVASVSEKELTQTVKVLMLNKLESERDSLLAEADTL